METLKDLAEEYVCRMNQLDTSEFFDVSARHLAIVSNGQRGFELPSKQAVEAHRFFLTFVEKLRDYATDNDKAREVNELLTELLTNQQRRPSPASINGN